MRRRNLSRNLETITWQMGNKYWLSFFLSSREVVFISTNKHIQINTHPHTHTIHHSLKPLSVHMFTIISHIYIYIIYIYI